MPMTTSTLNGIDAWSSAWSFAAKVHAQQKMPGSENSYLQHLGNVTMEIVAAHQAMPLSDLDLAIQCAMLHDTIEDQSVSYEQLSVVESQLVKAGAQIALVLNQALAK